MTFDEYWAALLAKNPDMKDARRMTISVDSFKRAIQQAFEKGRDQEKQHASFMDDLFGKLGK